ncbi:MAG: ribosome rescue protein RqcH, partial [Thermoproteota archaeon]
MVDGEINLSSFDYIILSSELNRELRDAWVDNIYHIPEYGYYLISFRLGGIVKRLLAIPGEAVFLTQFQYPVPGTPDPKLIRLRRIIRNMRVEKVEQHDFDRIIVITISKDDSRARIIVECLKRGVLVVASNDWTIFHTSKSIRTSSRVVKEGEKYLFPPSNIFDPRGETALLAGFSTERIDRFIAGKMGFGSKIMKEICERTELDPSSNVGNRFDLIIKAARALLKEAEENPSPRVYYSNGAPIDVSGLRLISSSLTQKEFKSISEAIDEYYAARGFEAKIEDRALVELEKLAKVREKLILQVEELSRKARTIMDNLTDFQLVIDAVRRREAKPDGLRIIRIDYEKKILQIVFKDMEFTLSFEESAASNASRMFEEAKKIEKHLNDIDSKIAKLREKTSEKVRLIPQKSVEKRWYEKFRWNKSVNGNLILVGKDAGTNELLVKKYVSDNSIVLHADFLGAPFVTIYGVEEPSREEVEEAALMAACYTTKAWESKYSSLDVYWVRGRQVSKQAPSGQYLPRGAFMIRGDRNFIRNVELKLWIGVTENGEIIYGSLDKIKRNSCKSYAYVVPGGLDKDR